MSDLALPVWAREEAFPLKPDVSPYGCRDEKGKLVSFDELDGLKRYLSSGKGKLAWIWVPEHGRLIAPEEYPSLVSTLKKRRRLFSEYDLQDGKRGLFLFGAILIYVIYAAYARGRWAAVGSTQTVGIAVMLFFFFAIRPYWSGLQEIKGLRATNKESVAAEIPEARFELWLQFQKSWITMMLIGLITAVGLVQYLTGGGFAEAGLVKARYAAGEWWRVHTAAFMHGNPLHFLMNVSALWYLGKRLETLGRWPHLAMVFFVSLLGAGWATTAWVSEGSSVGVSGAVCGLLGFLLVFETLHKPLVPKSARQRLLGILVSLVVIGALGFQFIDNAAHFGGLVAGAVYALVVFPKSSSAGRPIILKRDFAMGVGALLLICLSALAAIAAMLLQ